MIVVNFDGTSVEPNKATLLSTFEISRPLAQPKCRVALVGFGTVGRSVARLLHARSDERRLQLTHICNRQVARKKILWSGPAVMWTDDVHQLPAADVDIVVELMGGLEPAHQLVRRALQSGKSVVTANKQLIAHFGPELEKLAEANGQYLGFGACVAGGVPVLSGLQEGLAGDRIFQLRGILNGTCNYILTRMEAQGVSFPDALAEAQQSGFAESDPGDDVDGMDAAAKLAILARVGLQVNASVDQVICRSIREVRAIDFAYAHKLGCTIRQVSTALLRDGKMHLAVEPSLLPSTSPFAGVSGGQNLMVSTGEFGGDTSFGGCGAGGDPTAVAVVSDLLQAARFRRGETQAWQRPRLIPCEPMSDLPRRHYVRFLVRDRLGILAELSSAFARQHINLDAVLQNPGHAKEELPFVIALEPCGTSPLQAALAEIAQCDFLVEPPVRMPIVD